MRWWQQWGLISVAWLCLLACEVAAPGNQEAAAPTFEAAPDRPLPVLLLSLDGFRHDYRQRAATPHLDRLAAEGVVADGLVHVFPTKTFPTHWSMVTGRYVENHGVVANSMWDPQRDRRFSLRNRDAVMDPAWYDGEPIWRSAERQGLRAATFFWPGSEAPVGGSHASYWMQYDASIDHRDRIEQVLAWLDLPASERPDFITLYFSRVDSLGHRHGPESGQVTAAIADIDADIGLLLDGLEARGLLGRMQLLLVSDHGMADIDPERYIWLDDYLPLGDVLVSDWGPAAQIWATDMAVDDIVAALSDAHPRLRVWRREEIPADYRFRHHARIPDVLAEADHGWMISSRRNRGAVLMRPTRGMHGWDPLQREMHGIFIAHGPALQGGTRLPLLRSVDLYSLMAHLLDIDPAPNDGTLAPFGPVLASAGDAMTVVPPRPAVLYGLRRPEAGRALPLSEVTFDGGDGSMTLAGELQRECVDGDCRHLLRDGDRNLLLDPSTLVVTLDELASGPALVSGRLDAGDEQRLLLDAVLILETLAEAAP